MNVTDSLDFLGREDDLATLLDVEDHLPALGGVFFVGAHLDGGRDVERCAAIIERGLVEDGEPLPTVLVEYVRPHCVVRTFASPARGELYALEHRIAVDHVAEDKTDIGQRFLDRGMVTTFVLGRQDVAVDQLTLAGGLLFEDHIARVAGAMPGIHSSEQIGHRMIRGGVAELVCHSISIPLYFEGTCLELKQLKGESQYYYTIWV